MADICASDVRQPAAGDTASPVWKTILVGGLNHGGRGYYALDITTPASPKALWEFTHDNLGYSYGNPVITKLKDGTWVVIVASGYNNVGPGDGKGYLFILNADSGALIRAITTDVGDTTTPSGLARITAWANFPDNNNTAQRVYGGDLLGNLWRFDVNGDIPTTVDPPVYDAQRLATLKDAGGVAQPITSKPELGKIAGQPVVFVGTGQLLGATDPSLQRKTLVFTTNRPLEGGGCVPTATSFRYFLDYRTGNAIEGTEGIIGVKIGDFLATRAAVVVLSDDRLYGLTRTDRPGTEEGEIPTPPPGETVRRVSWRELVTE
jgi:Tfp pilus tip-associated adhesin PilY1